MRKKFSQNLYNETDNVGKMVGLYHVVNHEDAFRFGISDNKFAVDLWYTQSRLPLDAPPNTLEVEVKKTWKTGPQFPYDTVNVLHRKTKYFDAGADLLLVSGDYKYYMIITSDVILNSPIEEVPNKYVYKLEKFYKVPIKEVEIYQLPSIQLTTYDPLCHHCNGKEKYIHEGIVKCATCQMTQKYSKYLISG